jgi:hypothetical protein
MLPSFIICMIFDFKTGDGYSTIGLGVTILPFSLIATCSLATPVWPSFEWDRQTSDRHQFVHKNSGNGLPQHLDNDTGAPT